MRKNNGDSYKTIAILGSFRKYYNDIVEAAKIFTENGFQVLVPKLNGIQENSNDDFILLIGDEEKSPKQLEEEFLGKCLEADLVYVCNVGGYIGKTVMGELFLLAFYGQEVYFTPPLKMHCFAVLCQKSLPRYIAQ